MNHIYQTIWNTTLSCWIAAPENARSGGKAHRAGTNAAPGLCQTLLTPLALACIVAWPLAGQAADVALGSNGTGGRGGSVGHSYGGRGGSGGANGGGEEVGEGSSAASAASAAAAAESAAESAASAAAESAAESAAVAASAVANLVNLTRTTLIGKSASAVVVAEAVAQRSMAARA